MTALRSPRPDRKSSPLRFFSCDCQECVLERIHRAPWMRLVPGFALYRCSNCGSQVFRTKRHGVRLYILRPAARGGRGSAPSSIAAD